MRRHDATLRKTRQVRSSHGRRPIRRHPDLDRRQRRRCERAPERRRDDRPLRGARRAGGGRDGGGVSRVRPRAGARAGDQGGDAGDHQRQGAGPAARRGAGDGEAAARAHRAGVRRRVDGGGGVHRDAALQRGTLHDWLHGQKRPWREVVDRFVAAGQGLVAAHAAGLIHRDFKPKNVFLGDAGEPLVGDFGLAAPTASLPGDTTSSGTATTSTIAGTPAYMAPEQAQGAVLDARADQYAYCISFWEGLCGQRPTEAETRTEGPLAFARPLLDGRERGAPAWLLTAVARGFAAMPERRWPSIDALLTHIARRRRRRTRVAIGGGATLALAATAALFADPARPGGGAGSVRPPTARVAEIWNPARRSQLVATQVGEDPEQGAAIGARVSDAFDRLGEAWSAGHVRACRATRVEGRQSDELLDRRIACLDQAYGGFAESVRAFAAVTSPAVLDATIKVLDGLPDVAACADTSKYADQPPPPTDPDARARYRRCAPRSRRSTSSGSPGI
ncbi:MAG: protein kinase [Myxococcales bacterium]|nr:protein kinase [Myxococcales bacterium]